MSPNPSPHANNHMMPRGGLQAAEYEELGYGFLEIVGNSVCYVDGRTGKRLINFAYPTRRDATLQLSFFRQACQDARRLHTTTRLRQSRAEASDQKAAMTEPRNDEKTTAGMAFSPFAGALGSGMPADTLQGGVRLSPKLWQILDRNFPDPLVRMTFFSERQARAACETMNAKARRQRFEVVWMGA